jgi:metal-dependent hydrolase (beta-lactamase superfamily II)
VAEHGFSALVTVFSGGRRSSILYDGGLTPHGLANNLDIMQVDPAEDLEVVVSACSHAGAVNVLQNARRLTGRDQIAGFVGGFHLTGAVFEPIIEPTIAALTDLAVERFVPGHCTGWKATHRLAAALPDAFIQPSVGTVLRF